MGSSGIIHNRRHGTEFPIVGPWPAASLKGFRCLYPKVLGTFIGKLLILVFLVWLFHTIGFVLWQVTNFIKLSLLPDTPIAPIMAIMLLPSVYAVYVGIEGIARSSQVVFLPTVIILFSLYLLLIPDVNLQNLLPVFENGAANILRSSITPSPGPAKSCL